jgi:hypothetical protein
MVIFGAAPLIVSAFRRVEGSTFAEAVPAMRHRTRQSASTIRGGYARHDQRRS